MPQERIEVRYKQIFGNSGMYHKYILYTDGEGNQFSARGGPDKEGGFFDFSVNGVSINENEPFWFGPIETTYGIYNEDFIDFDGESDDPAETIIIGSDLSSYWTLIQQSMDEIRSSGYRYDPSVQNSNSTVDQALKDAGLPSPQNDGPTQNWAPGSGWDDLNV